MSLSGLKRYLPRGLYGRAALILILPILLLQMVVTIGFLQRHFEGVTRQMTRNVALEVNFVLDARKSDPEAARARALPLQLDLRQEHEIGSDRRRFYDISGRTVIETLRASVPSINWIDLATDDRRVAVNIGRGADMVTVVFDRRRVSASNPHQLLVLTISTGLLLMLIAFVFLRNQLRPIKRLADAAKAYGRGHRVDYRPSGASEVRAAGAAFLSMRGRLDRQIEQRTMMLSGVSHDLRTPLTRLKLGLSMLDDQDVANLMRDVDDMEELLRAFLDFARGDATEDTMLIDPMDVVEDVVRNGRRLGQHIDMFRAGPIGTVLVRPVALRRALTNLVSNARRHGTKCRITVTGLDRSVRFTVEDNGPGIPETQREDALKPFSRLDHARNQDKGGSVGLGLAIAADIVRSHGGSLRLAASVQLGGLKAEFAVTR